MDHFNEILAVNYTMIHTSVFLLGYADQSLKNLSY